MTYKEKSSKIVFHPYLLSSKRNVDFNNAALFMDKKDAFEWIGSCIDKAIAHNPEIFHIEREEWSVKVHDKRSLEEIYYFAIDIMNLFE